LASESSPPPPPGGGAKYAILGVVLLLLSAGAYWLTMSGEPPPTTTAADLPDAAVLQRSTSLQDETLEIPEEEPDAWSDIPDAGEVRPRGAARTGPGLVGLLRARSSGRRRAP
jgi:hypothetical protein